jgi:hypothetical protein
MVFAKSRMSGRASRPKIAFNFCTAWSFPEDSKLSILSTIELMLEMQSDGPNF